MRNIVLGLILVSVAATPAQAERFAILCKGKTLVGIGPEAGPMTGGEAAEKPAIFVIDEEAQTVGRYDKKKRTLDDACAFKLVCENSFSADRITMRGAETKEGLKRTALFDWDRRSGALELGFEIHLTNGNVMFSHSTLKCVPAPMPVLAAPAG